MARLISRNFICSPVGTSKRGSRYYLSGSAEPRLGKAWQGSKFISSRNKRRGQTRTAKVESTQRLSLSSADRATLNIMIVVKKLYHVKGTRATELDCSSSSSLLSINDVLQQSYLLINQSKIARLRTPSIANLRRTPRPAHAYPKFHHFPTKAVVDHHFEALR